ncbi:hypothetical protein HanXRQr2_Chr12g0564581 [Helianthus annuus]|uniref:Uncharacterized protein n=1 Tax=Helianthus annuus TaxID=4232 RepID=A0A251T6L2_HELAN|nr:hypothetical protein HanXRQr2_Chr12g0564581 [Helianthus annuus]KAJ0864602.1 hypothetical protein HanPSC8_Chr12g0543861 [Helianthus annuus]
MAVSFQEANNENINMNRFCSYHSNLAHKRRWHSNLNLLPLPRASTLPDVTPRE